MSFERKFDFWLADLINSKKKELFKKNCTSIVIASKLFM